MTVGAFGPKPDTAAIVLAAPGWRGVSPCSQSIATHDRSGEAEAILRAAKGSGRVSHAPKAGLFASKALSKGCEAMVR